VKGSDTELDFYGFFQLQIDLSINEQIYNYEFVYFCCQQDHWKKWECCIFPLNGMIFYERQIEPMFLQDQIQTGEQRWKMAGISVLVRNASETNP
jgi:hypothetical protein